MWEPRRLRTLWATACYRDSFTFYPSTPGNKVILNSSTTCHVHLLLCYSFYSPSVSAFRRVNCNALKGRKEGRKECELKTCDRNASPLKYSSAIGGNWNPTIGSQFPFLQPPSVRQLVLYNLPRHFYLNNKSIRSSISVCRPIFSWPWVALNKVIFNFL
jgi:hypothetical protein